MVRLIPTRDEPNEGGVVCKLQEFNRRVTGDAAVGVQGEEQRGKDAAHTSQDIKNKTPLISLTWNNH